MTSRVIDLRLRKIEKQQSANRFDRMSEAQLDDDCEDLVNRRTSKPVPATAQAATQQAHHLARHVEAWCGDSPESPFRYRDRGAIVSLVDYDGWGTLARYTFGGGRLKGLFARLGNALLYRQHQLSLLGPVRGPLAWVVDGLDRLVSPPVRLD